MNTAILKRAIDELREGLGGNGAAVRIDYVLGMLETLYEMSEPQYKIVGNNSPLYPLNSTVTPPLVDEAAILDAKARAAVETIKALSTPE